MMGYLLYVPGVEDYSQRYRTTHGVKLIDATSDAMMIDEQTAMERLAFDYAQAYNTRLLQFLRTQ
jgi:hypothetical protein